MDVHINSVCTLNLLFACYIVHKEGGGVLIHHLVISVQMALKIQISLKKLANEILVRFIFLKFILILLI